MVNDEHNIKDIKPFKKWFSCRWQAAKQKDSRYSYFAGAIISLILLIEIWFVVPGIPTGLGMFWDYTLITVVYLAAFFLINKFILPLLKFFYIKRYTYLVVVIAALSIQSLLITKQIGWKFEATLIFSALLSIVSLIFSLLISYLWFNSRKWTWLTLVFLSITAITSLYVVKELQLQQAYPVSEPELLQEILMEQQSEYHYNAVPLAHNPAEAGPFQFEHMTYSSSIDEYEAAFLQDDNDQRNAIVFPSVDGSAVLQDWSWAKQLYWGFSETDISISGELWIPEGEGPFPIVYIMHGNHISETDSSVGYTYLGELLASHGYIVSSIDANFLNFSAWSGIVDNDQLLRAWLFLAHINSFHKANLLPIDWNNVALIGHSRGGQAAAMAVDIERWLKDDKHAKILEEVNIKAVIAIAPTDYAVDGKLAYLNDVNYLTLHGTLDSDLTQFFGERQFERTTVNNDTYKASVIIYGANHGQFNETWGKYDDQFPAALMLNTEHILDEEAQQMAAKIYINGFLGSIFSQQNEYRQLFQDHRVAQDYLPIAGYITQYEDANMDYYYTFEQERELKPISASSQLTFDAVELKGRNGTSKYNDVLKINWDIGYSKIRFPIKQLPEGKSKREIAAFVFQVAKTQASKHIEAVAQMNIEVDFIAKDTIARLDLKNSFSLLDPYFPSYLKLDFLEETIKNGKYEPKEEPYLQTYVIPVDLIKEHLIGESEWDSSTLTAIQLWFKDRSGSILLDDIGVIYEGGSYVKYEQ